MKSSNILNFQRLDKPQLLFWHCITLSYIYQISVPLSPLTSTTLVNAIGAGITATDGTRFALQLILDKAFKLFWTDCSSSNPNPCKNIINTSNIESSIMDGEAQFLKPIFSDLFNTKNHQISQLAGRPYCCHCETQYLMQQQSIRKAS